MSSSHWLNYAQRLAAVAQGGLAYCRNPYDRERYHQMQEIAAEMISEGCGEPAGTLLDLLENQAGYATPKLDVRGVVFHDDKILMVREIADSGKWTLPGGWVDINTPPGKAVEKEMREEAGIIVKAEKLLAVYDRNLHGHPPYPFHAWKLFFLCRLIADATPDPLETADPTYFSERNLPQLSIDRVTEEEIHRMFEHLRNPDLPTDFD